MKVFNIEEIREQYSFLFEDAVNGKEVYFCNCGETTVKDNGTSYTVPEVIDLIK